ncbi:Ribosome biogenesis bms1, partial [Brachionus plicatilis]
MSDIESHQQPNKSHHKKQKGAKAKKKDNRKNFETVNEESGDKKNESFETEDDYRKARARNPRAFALQSFVAAERQFRRTQDIKAKRIQMPEVDRASLEPPPIFVAIVGPPRVGKSILMQSLVKNYTRQKLNNIKGPVTVVGGKKRRITFYECNNDLNSMIDAAKVADLVLLMIDSSFGFEMETFEFLNICQVHGFPRIMGFKDIGYRLNHSFIVCDRLEDLTQPDLIRQNEKCDRNVCLYGYVRGSGLKNKSNVHIPGVGDFQLNDVSFLSDPCPLPDKEKKRTLDDRERLIYAPFSGVGGLIYDKDAVYIELGGSHSHMIDNTYSSNNPLLNQVISSKNTVDSKLTSAKLKMFSDAPDIDSYLEDEQIEANDSGKEESEGDFESSDDQSEDEEEDEEEEDEMEESEMDEKEEDEEEDEETWGSLKWKENLKEKANIAYSMNKTNRTNWSKVIYGNQRNDEENQSVPNDDDADDDNLFKIKKINLNDYSEKIDNSKYNTSFNKWTEEKTNNDEEQSEAAFDSIRDCFVTGKWDKNSDAAHLLAGDDDDEVDENDFDDDDEMFGDFEDMETGENFHQLDAPSDSQNDDEQNKNERKKTKSEMSKRERLIEKKKRLKEQFDREFDESKSGDKTGESAYYDALKEEATDQTNLNRLEFEKLDDMQRIEFEGFRVGMYVRIEINSMPCEFVKNFDARYLAIVGCLESNEANIGYVQVRLKKHRWHNKILKTNDPLVISLGWRRFQTLP